MPRLKRRAVRRASGFTRAQIETLLHGAPVIEPDEPVFANAMERRAAWDALRDELMAVELPPLQRPAGW